MKFVDKNSDYEDLFIVSFQDVRAASRGHQWNEMRLRIKDVKQLLEMPDKELRSWLEFMLSMAKR